MLVEIPLVVVISPIVVMLVTIVSRVITRVIARGASLVLELPGSSKNQNMWLLIKHLFQYLKLGTRKKGTAFVSFL